MKLSELSINRPVLATVFSLILILFGVVGLTRLSVREYPDIDPPIVSAVTTYFGASPEVVERTITEILEDELVSIGGIKSLVSQSREGVSVITVEFELDQDIEVAAQEVRDRVARARGRLPDDIEEPTVSKEDADAQAILWVSLFGEGYTPLQVTDYADRYIVDQLQTVDGVSRVILGGGREYSMRLWLDPALMAARRVTVLDVRQALQDQNVDIPSGRIEGLEREFTVKTLGEMKRPEAFNELIIKTVQGVPVYLKDIGHAEVGPRNERSLVRFNGKNAIGLGVVKQSKANTLAVAQGIKEKLKEIQPSLPPNLNMVVAYDGSIFIERSITEVRNSIFVAGVLVFLVIFGFLGRFRYTLIPGLTIPISIIATFAVLEALGFTINNLTLLALILAIGLVVDDAIVVLENIVRHIEMGKPPRQAALEGMREIGFAVIATTIALVAVFLPLAYMKGAVGRLFFEFAIALSGAVIISTFVALTLAPMLCSKWLTAAPQVDRDYPGEIPMNQPPRRTSLIRRIAGWGQQAMTRMANTYGKGLHWAMGNQWKTLTAAGLIIAISGVLFVAPMILRKEFLPTEDRAFILTILSGPEGATLDSTKTALFQMEDIFQDVPEVDRFFAALALSREGPGEVNSGIMFTALKPWEERARSQQEIVQSLFPQALAIPEAMVFPINPPSGPQRGFGKPFQMVIRGFDLQELNDVSDKVMARLSKEVPGLIQVDSDLKLNKPQLEIEVLRKQAADLGISVRDIATTMQILLGGLDLSTFEFSSKRYDVMVQMPADLRQSPSDLADIYLESEQGAMVPLTSVIRAEETVAPKALNHYDRLRSVTISGAVLPFISLGDAINKAIPIAQEEMSSNMSLDWSGDSRELLSTEGSVYFVFAIALLVVFLTLSAQFESFLHPMVILVTVPLAVAGAIISLFVLGASVNVYSQIGIILLIGLVTKNGILIVEYANQQYEAGGITPAQAVEQAAKIRFRPILMTAISTIFGSLPLALAVGAGAESRQALGIAIVGGMLFSTLLTLFVVPIVYRMVNGWRKVKPVSAEEPVPAYV